MRFFNSEECKVLESSVKSSILTAANRQKALPYRDRPKPGASRKADDKVNPKASSDSSTKRKRESETPGPKKFVEVSIPGIFGTYRLVRTLLAGGWGILNSALNWFCILTFYCLELQNCLV